ncbi:dicarboxylate/amino acid:cation symporter [Peribacillus huizhouensis]|uniref:Na+/H+-dicarboxylate symporter n=1 Tax=Peribacillus huizhouensis TaxID=1501239 RepID=A0ABR6CMF7_9BACI|nr:dicarboxylate/amino acid:cation symporter [Peribacillus huizhouensis]MBA9026198.1 Na+/H+-dicarboxylate symporter [Peribacillus huizhouensis]
MKVKLGLLPRIILAIILGIVIGSFAPENLVRGFATFNGIFGNFIGFVIPFIIIGFIAPGIGQLGKGAGKLLGLTTAFAYVSTIIAGAIAFIASYTLLPNFISGNQLINTDNPEEFLLQPFFVLEMPPIMEVISALLFAFIIGIGLASIKGNTLQHAFDDFQLIVEKLIKTAIIPILPFHIFGIFANMTYGGQVQSILSVFAKVFVLIIVLHIVMLILQYSVGGLLHKKNPLTLLKIMSPAYFTAVGTQSSAATIPVTLGQVKKTGVQGRIADFTVPLLATVHLSGSMITLVSCSVGVLLLNGTTPTITMYIPFILMLGVTMVAAPGVPGGAVMAALGVLETMLGFDQTMISLMIALYLAQDSLGTATNVTGDGALTMIVDKFTPKKAGKMEQSNAAI